MAAPEQIKIKQEPHSPTMDEPSTTLTLTRAVGPPPLTATNYSQVPMMIVNPIKKEENPNSESIPPVSPSASNNVLQSQIITTESGSSLLEWNGSSTGSQNIVSPPTTLVGNHLQPSIPIMHNNKILGSLILGTNTFIPATSLPCSVTATESAVSSFQTPTGYQGALPGSGSGIRLPVALHYCSLPCMGSSKVATLTTSYNSAGNSEVNSVRQKIPPLLAPKINPKEPNTSEKTFSGLKKSAANKNSTKIRKFKTVVKRKPIGVPRKKRTPVQVPKVVFNTHTEVTAWPPLEMSPCDDIGHSTGSCSNNLSDSPFLPKIKFCYSMKRLKLKDFMEILDSGYDIMTFVKPGTHDYIRAQLLCNAAKKHGVTGIHPGIQDAFYTSLISPYIPALETKLLKADIANTLRLREEDRPQSDEKIASPETKSVSDNSNADCPSKQKKASTENKSVNDNSNADCSSVQKITSPEDNCVSYNTKSAYSGNSTSEAASVASGRMNKCETDSHDKSVAMVKKSSTCQNVTAMSSISSITQAPKLTVATLSVKDSEVSHANQVSWEKEKDEEPIVCILDSDSETSEYGDEVNEKEHEKAAVDVLPKWKNTVVLLDKFNTEIGKVCSMAAKYGFFSCYLCTFATYDLRYVHKHIAEAHYDPAKTGNPRKNFICTHCCAKALDISYLKDHELRYHLSEYPCYFCGIPNNTLEKLLRHICYSHSEVYNCNCGDQLIGKRAFLQHSKQKKHFQPMISNACMCLYCSLQFTDFATLESHILKNHIDKPVPNKDERICFSCRHIFMDDQALKVHESCNHDTDTLYSLNIATLSSIQRQVVFLTAYCEHRPRNLENEVDSGQSLSFEWTFWKEYLLEIFGIYRPVQLKRRTFCYPYGDLVYTCKVTKTFKDMLEKLPMTLDKLLEITLERFRQVQKKNILSLTKRFLKMLSFVSRSVEFVNFLKSHDMEHKFCLLGRNPRQTIETAEIIIKGNVYRYPLNEISKYCAEKHINFEVMSGVMNRLLLLVFAEFPHLKPNVCFESPDFWDMVVTVSRTPLGVFLLETANLEPLPWNELVEHQIHSFVLKVLSGKIRFGVIEAWPAVTKYALSRKTGLSSVEMNSDEEMLNKPILSQMFDLRYWASKHGMKGMDIGNEELQRMQSEYRRQMEENPIEYFPDSYDESAMWTDDYSSVTSMGRNGFWEVCEKTNEKTQTLDPDFLHSKEPRTTDRSQKPSGDALTEETGGDNCLPDVDILKMCKLTSSQMDKKYETSDCKTEVTIKYEYDFVEENFDNGTKNKKRKIPSNLVHGNFELDSVGKVRKVSCGNKIRTEIAARTILPVCVKNPKHIKCSVVVLERSAAADKMAEEILQSQPNNQKRKLRQIYTKSKLYKERQSKLATHENTRQSKQGTQKNEKPFGRCPETYEGVEIDQKEVQILDEKSGELLTIVQLLQTSDSDKPTKKVMDVKKKIQRKLLRPRKKVLSYYETDDSADGNSDNEDDMNYAEGDNDNISRLNSSSGSFDKSRCGLSSSSTCEAGGIVTQAISSQQTSLSSAFTAGISAADGNMTKIKQEPIDPSFSSSNVTNFKVQNKGANSPIYPWMKEKMSKMIYIPLLANQMDSPVSDNKTITQTTSVLQNTRCTNLTSTVQSSSLQPIFSTPEILETPQPLSQNPNETMFIVKTPQGVKQVVNVPISVQKRLQSPFAFKHKTQRNSKCARTLKCNQQNCLPQTIKSPSNSKQVSSTSFNSKQNKQNLLGLQPINQKPSGLQQVVHTPSSLQQNQAPAVQQLVQTPSGLQQLVQTPSGLQQLVQTPSGLQQLVQTPSGLQQLVQTPSGLQQVVQTPSGLQQLVQTPSGVQQLVTPSGLKQLVQTPTSLPQLVQTPTSLPLLVQTPSGLQQIVQTASGLQQLIQTPSGTQQIVQNPSGSQQVILSPSGQLFIVQPPTDLQQTAAKSSSSQQQSNTPQLITNTSSVSVQQNNSQNDSKTVLSGTNAMPESTPTAQLPGGNFNVVRMPNGQLFLLPFENTTNKDSVKQTSQVPIVGHAGDQPVSSSLQFSSGQLQVTPALNVKQKLLDPSIQPVIIQSSMSSTGQSPQNFNQTVALQPFPISSSASMSALPALVKVKQEPGLESSSDQSCSLNTSSSNHPVQGFNTRPYHIPGSSHELETPSVKVEPSDSGTFT